MTWITLWLVRAWMLLARIVHWRRRKARFIVMLGGPGAGKGTHSSRLAAALAIPHLSTGDLLRQQIAAGTGLGLKVRAYVEAGQLVPDELSMALLKEELEKPDYQRGAVLDGFPRTLVQALLLERLLMRWGNTIERAVLLDVPEADLIDRLMRRQRSDDSPRVIAERLRQFNSAAQPLCAHYQSQGLLATVVSTNARTKADVFAEVKADVFAEVKAAVE